MDGYNPTAGYTQHSCGANMSGNDMNATIPTLEDIANYNYMTPQQQAMQKQQVKHGCDGAFGDLPFPVSSRQRAALTGGQTAGGTQAVMGAQMTPGMQMAGTAQMLPAAGMLPATGMQPAAGTGQMIPGVQGDLAGQMMQGQSAPITPTTQPYPITGESLQYLNGFLRTQIGRAVNVSFLIGTNTVTDRNGILLGVGANYILLNEAETDDLLACDFYNIKFIKFYY